RVSRGTAAHTGRERTAQGHAGRRTVSLSGLRRYRERHTEDAWDSGAEGTRSRDGRLPDGRLGPRPTRSATPAVKSTTMGAFARQVARQQYTQTHDRVR